MNLRQPDASVVADPVQLTTLLRSYYDAITDLQRVRPASSVPALKAITLPLLADLRNTTGDNAGERGPRGVILSGGAAPFDGLQGVFVWDSNAPNADDGFNIIRPTALLAGAAGRWRRIL